SEFGVPQRRRRLVVVGVRRDTVGETAVTGMVSRLFDAIRCEGKWQLELLGDGSVVTAKEAISDLETEYGINTVEYGGEGSHRGYRQAKYSGPYYGYQEALHEGADVMDSMRLARHTADVRERFQRILDETWECRGKNLSPEIRKRLGASRKHRIVPMDP